MHTCVNRGSNHLPQALRVTSSPLTTQSHVILWDIPLFYINIEIDLQRPRPPLQIGRVTPSPAPKNIFLFYSKKLFKFLNIVKQI